MYRFAFAALIASSAPALSDVPSVLTDFAPIHALTEKVMDGVGTPGQLLPQGADAHTFQMKPSQMRALSNADLLVWVGPDMTPWLERALESSGTGTSLALMDEPGTHLRAGGHNHDHEAHGDDDHADHDDHGHEEHASGEHSDHAEHSGDEKHAEGDPIEHPDPHTWLSPENGAYWLSVIAEHLSELDPEHAAKYGENAKNAIAELAALDTEIKAQLEPFHDKAILVFHDAHGYFMDHYGIKVAGAIRESDNAAPSAARLSEVTHLIEDGDVVCVFSESGIGADLVSDLTRGTDIGTGVLDPAGSLLSDSADGYFDLLRNEADALSGCLK